MIKLRNPAGNVYKEAATEHRKKELEAQGYILVEDDAPAKTKTVEEMTVAELKAYAAANGIDLTGATRKEEILARIVEAEKAKAEE